MRGDPRGPEPIRQVRAPSKQRGARFASGAAWLVADPLKETSNGELWQQAAAYLLMVHGAAAMVTLTLLGAGIGRA